MSNTDNIIPFPRRKRSKPVAKPLTEEIASKIKTLVILKGMAQQTVAAMFNINQGRVSEVVNGHKFPDAPFWPINDI